MRYERFLGTATTLAMLVPFVAGCGDDNGTGPEADGSVGAVVTDDPSDGSAAIGPSGDLRLSEGSSSAQFEGTFSGEAQVQLSVDGQTFVDVGAPQQVSFALQSDQQAVVHASASVPANSYTRVRLVLNDARATVAAGSTVGGLVLSVDSDVMVGGGGDVTIDLPLSLNVTADTETTVAFDLNSEQWVNEASVQAQSAAAAEVQNATTVSVQ